MKHSPVIAVLALAVVLLAVNFASAHEGRTVGPYTIELGWRSEPAYTTLLNGPELEISREGTAEPIADSDIELTLTVTFGPATKSLRLRPVEGKPGTYTADLIPMRPGDYSFAVTGTIGGTSVNESFSSSEGEFSTVEPISDIQFPES